MREIAVIAELQESCLVPDGLDFIVSGVGYWNVYKSLCLLDKQTRILNFGYAGSNCLDIGESYKVGRSLLYAPNIGARFKPYILGDGVDCYTASDFVTCFNGTTPALFDMELYAILSMGFSNVISVKTVSDTLSISQYRMTLSGD